MSNGFIASGSPRCATRCAPWSGNAKPHRRQCLLTQGRSSLVKAATIAIVVFGIGLNARADFAEDFQAAKKLFDAKDYGRACPAFTELAAVAPNDYGKACSLFYAAVARGRQEQYESAIKLAGTILPRPMAVLAQMEIMDANRKHNESIAVFRAEDISTWPDRINYKGFFLRATAYSRTGEKQAAVEDYRKCIALAGSDTQLQLEAMNRMAAVLLALGDVNGATQTYDRAFAAFEENPNLKGSWLFPQAILGAAQIAIDRGDYDHARKRLGRFRLDKEKGKRGPWEFLVLEAYGDICVAEGKQNDALARYRDAVSIDTHKSYVARVKKKIEELQSPGDSQ